MCQEELVATISMMLFFAAPLACFLTVACSLIGWQLGYCCCGWLSLVVTLLTAFACFYPTKPAAGIMHNLVLTAIFKYFSFRLVLSPMSKWTADRPYIHVCAPHNVFPFGGMLWQFSPFKTSRY